ncbi:MAG: TetR/AcrR family transcriptional regulator [Proteobacteria bacterium]|nr:MAG: TetR/AcrR family transcriptional regulator [Pseudomonadota bacterium]
MARTRPPDRFQQLLDTALRVFAHKGVRRTRMSDIAREMGVSPGSLYNYVESKEALFHWIVERGAADGVVEAPDALPIRLPAPAVARRRLREELGSAFRIPALEAAFARRAPADARAELEKVVRAVYAQVERARRPMTVIERSAPDLPELYALYFVQLRREFFARFADWVARRQRGGHFRDDVDPRVAARFALESIVYFARHRFGDLDPDAGLPDDDAVREHVVRLVLASLLPDPPRPRRRRT